MPLRKSSSPCSVCKPTFANSKYSLHSISEETAEEVTAASKASSTLVRSRLSMVTVVSSVGSGDDMTENEENRRQIEEMEDEIFILRRESHNVV